MIRAAIVEDEAPARQRIKHLLAAESDIDVVGEAASGREALELVSRVAPDLLFLDVQMPDYDGLQLLATLEERVPEYLIFVTAYDQYALQAFEYDAVDYLLKPFTPERFASAVDRVRKRAASPPGAPADMQAIAAQVRADQSGYFERIAVKARDRVLLLKPGDVDWIDAQGNYVVLHVGENRYVLRDKIGAIELKLDPAMFARIHRSTIVNLDRIRELRPLFHGEYTVVLHNGTQVTLSRRYKERLQQRWGHAL